MKIVYPTDGSKTASEALVFATDIARAFGASLVVVSVAQELDEHHEAIHGVERLLFSFAGDYAHQAAEEVRKLGLVAEERVETGKPADLIVKIARVENAYAIVMGTHGRTSLARTVIGSVADRIIRHAPCPVILVPSREDL